MATAKKQKGASPSTAGGGAPKIDKRVVRKEQARQTAKAVREARRAEYHAKRVAMEKDAAKPLPSLKVANDGRPTYDQMTDEQLEWFEEQVCLGTFVKHMPGMRADFPSEWQLWKGIGNEHSKLHALYARGKQIAVARREELIEETAATPIPGEVVTEGQRVTKDGDVVNVVEVRRADMVEHRRLLIDTHKWALAHIRPRKHGRQADVEAGKPNEQLKALFDALMQGPAE